MFQSSLTQILSSIYSDLRSSLTETFYPFHYWCSRDLLITLCLRDWLDYVREIYWLHYVWEIDYIMVEILIGSIIFDLIMFERLITLCYEILITLCYEILIGLCSEILITLWLRYWLHYDWEIDYIMIERLITLFLFIKSLRTCLFLSSPAHRFARCAAPRFTPPLLRLSSYGDLFLSL
jgi:hypothetical protein